MEKTSEEMYILWSTGKAFLLNGIKYSMHKMSYGDYFAEPTSYKGVEKDGFSNDIIWYEKFIENGKVFYREDILLNSI